MSKITPIIIENKGTLIIEEPNLPSLETKNTKDIIPFVDESDNLILEMSGQGPQGPKGPTGNGIDRIEKTSTSGVIDTYTIYFTNGSTFNYEIVNGVIYYYDGPYEVTPMANTAQILPTNNLAMSDDVTVNEIPYQEVSNLSGGLTATIGD